MKRFSIFDRDSAVQDLASEEFDLAIVGGGINGAGVARDAASRGMKVALIEADDFASGTSSRSSKLIHGGIRYLENLEFGLVFEALSERTLLFEIAPNLVHPLRFVLPIYENARVGMFKMGLGMWLYDALALFNVPEMHERLNSSLALEHLPLLDPKGLKGAYVYSDAYMDDDFLVIETLRSAHELGAKAVSYVKATGCEQSDGKVFALNCHDFISGKDFQIKSKHFVGSVGPWTDLLGQDLFKDWKKTLRPTKGVHLTFERNRLPLKDAVVMVDDEKQRIVFGIPRHEMTILGTTDTDFQGDPGQVRTEREDVEYLLNVSKEYFPGADLKEEDIVASYAGVRPLVADDSESEGKTSREHKIWNDPRNITFVAGGKYTTYRYMAEEIVDECLNCFSLEQRAKFSPSNTKVPLVADCSQDNMWRARQLVNSWVHESGLPEEVIEKFVERYGMETKAILSRLSDKVREPIELEALHAIENGMCFHLDDFYLRRTRLFLAQKDHGLSDIENTANLFAERLSWSEKDKTNEIQRVKEHEDIEMSWKSN